LLSENPTESTIDFSVTFAINSPVRATAKERLAYTARRARLLLFVSGVIIVAGCSVFGVITLRNHVERGA
jgi:hypothetical protein